MPQLRFRGPCNHKMDLSVRRVAQRLDISQNIQKRFKKYPKIDCRTFAFSRHHCYVAANHTVRDIPDFGPFWIVKIQGGGNMPPLPPR